MARVLSEEAASHVAKLFKAIEEGAEGFKRCQQDVLNAVDVEIQAVRDLAVDMEHTSLLEPSNVTRMKRLSKMVIPGGVVAIFNKLKALPIADVLLQECLYLQSLA